MVNSHVNLIFLDAPHNAQFVNFLPGAARARDAAQVGAFGFTLPTDRAVETRG